MLNWPGGLGGLPRFGFSIRSWIAKVLQYKLDTNTPRNRKKKCVLLAHRRRENQKVVQAGGTKGKKEAESYDPNVRILEAENDAMSPRRGDKLDDLPSST